SVELAGKQCLLTAQCSKLIIAKKLTFQSWTSFAQTGFLKTCCSYRCCRRRQHGCFGSARAPELGSFPCLTAGARPGRQSPDVCCPRGSRSREYFVPATG